MKTLKISFILLFISVFAITSCSKEAGFEGTNTIKGSVLKGGTPTAGAIVHIAFGTKDATTTFDATTITDASGAYKFEGLQKGDYFVDADYTTNLNILLSSGGAAVTLGGTKGEVTVDLTVQ